MDEDEMSPDHWLGSVPVMSFSVLTLLVGWQEGHPNAKKTAPVILEGSVSEQLEKENRGVTSEPVFVYKMAIKVVVVLCG